MKISLWIEPRPVKGVGAKIKWHGKVYPNAKAYIYGRIDGHRTTFGGYLSTRVAESLLPSIEAKIINGEINPTEHGLSLGQAIDEYLIYCQRLCDMDAMAVNTVRIYRDQLNKLLEFFTASVRLGSIDYNKMLKMRDSYLNKAWRRNGAKNKFCINGIRMMIKNISPMFGYYLKRNKIIRNPCQAVLDDPAFEEQKVARFLKFDELVSLANACAVSKRLSAKQNEARIEFWNLLTSKLSTGMRIGELLRAERDNYLNGRLTLIGRKKSSRNKNKRDKTVIVPMNIRPIFEMAVPGKRVFEGWSLDRAERFWSRLRVRAKIIGRARLHDLRHTWAGFALSSPSLPASRAQIGMVLGHESDKATEIYSHFDINSLEPIVEGVGKIINSIPHDFGIPTLPSILPQ